MALRSHGIDGRIADGKIVQCAVGIEVTSIIGNLGHAVEHLAMP